MKKHAIICQDYKINNDIKNDINILKSLEFGCNRYNDLLTDICLKVIKINHDLINLSDEDFLILLNDYQDKIYTDYYISKEA